MSSTGSPIPLTAGTPVAVPGEPTGQPTVAVTLANLSSFALSVQMGNSVEYVPPWTEQTFTKGLTGPLPVITPELLPGAPSAGTASLLVTYWWPDDAVPPEAPVTLVAAAIAAAISGVVQVVTSPGTSLNVTGTLDANITNATLNVATAANVIFTAADTAPLVTNVEIPGIAVGAGLTAYYQVDGAGGTVAADYLLVLLRSGANLTEVQYLQFALQFLLATDAQGNIANLGLQNYVQTFVAPINYDPSQYYQVAYLIPLGGLTWIGGTIGFALKNTGGSGFSDNVYLSVAAHLDTVPVAVPGGVVVNSGTVSIGNTPSVTISGTPAVTISSGSVTIASGTVTVSTSPGSPLNVTGPVTISSGTVTVQTAAGAPISITGSVTISGTSTVTISGTPTVNIAAGQVVQVENVTGGSVTIAGTVNIGNTPAVSISGTPTVTITSGSVDIGSGNITIVGGQGGINVSTDAPPVAGPTVTIPAAADSVTLTLHPPANATAIGFAFVPIATYTLQVTVQDALTLVTLEDFTFPAAGPGVPGRSLTLPLTPGMTESGIIVTATAGAALAVATDVGYSLWYIGTNSFQPVNLPTQPLFVQGQGAEGVAQSATYPAGSLDSVNMGLGAAALNSKAQAGTSLDAVVQGINAAGGTKLPLTGAADQFVQGIQGSGGASVQTAREAPQKIYSLGQAVTANTVVQAINGVAGQSIRLRRLSLAASINGSEVDLQTSPTPGSAVFAKFEPTNGPLVFDFEGYVMPAGDNLYLVLYWPASTVIVLVTLTYDQF